MATASCPIEEIDAGRKVLCEGLRSSLDVQVNGVAAPLTLSEAGLAFPPGAGGLSTMRVGLWVHGWTWRRRSRQGRPISFADRSFTERLGWREIVVTGRVRRWRPRTAATRPTRASRIA